MCKFLCDTNKLMRKIYNFVKYNTQSKTVCEYVMYIKFYAVTKNGDSTFKKKLQFLN